MLSQYQLDVISLGAVGLLGLLAVTRMLKRTDEREFYEWAKAKGLPDVELDSARAIWMAACRRSHDERARFLSRAVEAGTALHMNQKLAAAMALYNDESVPRMVRSSVCAHWIHKWMCEFMADSQKVGTERAIYEMLMRGTP